ncbi:MAG: DUF7833 domain-containing protein [Candidatus Hodarchaeales archaeon]
MPKRFTETEKWKDPWFRKLNAKEKLLFIYLIENCDVAGFIEIEFDLVGFQTGLKSEEIPGLIKGLTRGLLGASEGLAWGYLGAKEFSGVFYVKNYLRHQKNLPLNKYNNAHKGIIAKIVENAEFYSEIEHNFFAEIPCHHFKKTKDQNIIEDLKEKLGASEPLARGTGKGKGKGKGKESNTSVNSFEGGVGETLETSAEQSFKLENLKNELQNAHEWQIVVYRSLKAKRDIQFESIQEWIEIFILEIEAKGNTLGTIRETKSYFVNWLKIQLDNEKNNKSRRTNSKESGELTRDEARIKYLYGQDGLENYRSEQGA